MTEWRGGGLRWRGPRPAGRVWGPDLRGRIGVGVGLREAGSGGIRWGRGAQKRCSSAGRGERGSHTIRGAASREA